MNHTIQNEHLTVTAAARGAELQSILGADGTEYLWQGDPRYWSDRALNIFPCVARLTNGSYYLDGQLHHMGIHGIAPYRADEETLQSYPRRFVFRVTYALQGGTLAVTYEVENRDERTMYFGLGGHPGFRVPLADGASFEDYRLRFSSPFPLENGRDIPLRHELFDRDAIVLRDMDRALTLETGRDGRGVTVSFPGMDYVGIWHKPKTDAPYVCIEPWCSLPAVQDVVTVMEERRDYLRLEADGVYRNQWTIEIHSRAQ